ncbi:hypothetical protein [Streptomyces sp. S.PNR 29]|uniref:hypothetical protein n=1 Tax=Streptomyces sp. S.PNR 29 TaxID=2973805 RepID=UPI0025AFA912|nr:hypothetical protein [Streptomyces sp. S.PNR 29]MDN0198719.1 hypothetical protein [Streptomyces sp. S.PNR 29]
MRVIRVASAALLGAATALTLTVSAASAQDDEPGEFRVSVFPSTVVAGGAVALHTTGCDRYVTVSSGVFDPLILRTGQTWATAVVDRDAEPGAMYEVTFHCGTFWRTVDLAIAPDHPHRSASGAAPTRAEPTDYPKAVDAGEGGSLAGFDLREIGLGLALVMGSVGAAYHLSRRGTRADGG